MEKIKYFKIVLIANIFFIVFYFCIAFIAVEAFMYQVKQFREN